MNRGLRRRDVVSVFVIAFALAAVVAGARARRLAARVDALAIDARCKHAAPKTGDGFPAAPFRYGVISSPRGDHADVGAAVEAMCGKGVDFVVLAGNVLDRGDESECRKLAAAVRDRGVPVLAVPGPRDVGHAGEFARWVGPTRWWFVHRRALVVGTPDDSAESREFVRAAEDVARPVAVVRFVGDQAGACGAVVRSCPADGVDEAVATSRVTFSGVWRTAALDVVAPIVDTTEGFTAWCVGCGVVVAAAIALRRSRARSTEPDDAGYATRRLVVN
jgi:hypothetical protein